MRRANPMIPIPLVLVALLPAAADPAPEPLVELPPMERILPADTLVWTEIDLPGTVTAARERPPGRIWNEPAMQDLRAAAGDWFERVLERQMQRLPEGERPGFSTADLRALLAPLRELTVGPANFTGRIGVAAVPGEEAPGLVLYADLRETAFARLALAALFAAAREEGIPATTRHERVRGIRIHSLVPATSASDTLSYFHVGDRFLVTVGEGTATDLLERASGPAGGGLAVTEAFAKGMEAVRTDDSTAFLYIRPDGAAAAIRPLLDWIAGEVPGGTSLPEVFLGISGIDRIRSIVAAAGPDGAGFASRLRLDWEEPGGLLACLAVGEGESLPDGLRDLPPTLQQALAFRFDPARLWALLPEGTADLADGIGPGVAIGVAPPSGFPPLPRLVTAIDAADAAGTLDRIRAYAAAPGRGIVVGEIERDGTRILTIRGEAGWPVAPALCVHDGKLLAATDPSLLLESIAIRTAGEEKSLASLADFREALGRIPDGSTGIAYADSRVGFAESWGRMRTMLPILNLTMLAPQGIPPFPATALPPAETFTRHLFPAVTGWRADADGLVVTGHGPMDPGGEIVLAGGILAGLAVAAPRLDRILGSAAPEIPADDTEALRSIHEGIARFRAETGRTPESLDTIEEGGFLPQGLASRYGYRPPPEDSPTPASHVVAWTPDPTRGVHRVLFLDGSVASLPPEALDRLLDKQR